MKTGRYLTIKKAFAMYLANKKRLAEFPTPGVSSVDYSGASHSDSAENTQEKVVINYLAKKEELEKLIRLVDETILWFIYEGYGRERYIKLRMIEGNSPIWTCNKIGVDDRTGRRWQRDIYEKAEMIAEGLGV